ncbi:MAG: hypothetical protein NVS9B1_15800 [Candidatus Dormibacteraceae bacterium]
MSQRKRPGRLWLFFYGRRRRGFPGLLVAVLLLAIGLGLTFASRLGTALSHLIGLAFLVVLAALVLGALILFLIAALRQPGGR